MIKSKLDLEELELSSGDINGKESSLISLLWQRESVTVSQLELLLQEKKLVIK